MKTWLVLDVNYLGYRAVYSTGGLMAGNIHTGVLFGVYRDIASLNSYFDSNDFVFCFDLGKQKRLELWPHYKEHRDRSPHPNRVTLLRSLPKQIESLRTTQLEKMGFRNVFSQDGYEADDIIASVACNLSVNERAIIISADSDLFQLLKQDRVSIYKPREKEFITEETFREKWGLEPSEWVEVKSISGCSSDNVPGVPRVKEITAAKYLRGELTAGSMAYSAIKAWIGSDEWKRSKQLVTLPYPGTEKFKAIPHEPVTDKAWDKMMDSLQIKALKRDTHYMRNKMIVNKP